MPLEFPHAPAGRRAGKAASGLGWGSSLISAWAELPGSTSCPAQPCPSGFASSAVGEGSALSPKGRHWEAVQNQRSYTRRMPRAVGDPALCFPVLPGSRMLGPARLGLPT